MWIWTITGGHRSRGWETFSCSLLSTFTVDNIDGLRSKIKQRPTGCMCESPPVRQPVGLPLCPRDSDTYRHAQWWVTGIGPLFVWVQAPSPVKEKRWERITNCIRILKRPQSYSHTLKVSRSLARAPVFQRALSHSLQRILMQLNLLLSL